MKRPLGVWILCAWTLFLGVYLMRVLARLPFDSVALSHISPAETFGLILATLAFVGTAGTLWSRMRVSVYFITIAIASLVLSSLLIALREQGSGMIATILMQVVVGSCMVWYVSTLNKKGFLH